jgi:iron complex outermembrane receptor protein
MRKNLLILFISLFTTCIAFSQVKAQTRVTGKLLDAQTHEPLIGASILVKGTTAATSAGLDGSFKINVPNGSEILVISYIGYVTKQVNIEGKKNVGVVSLDPTSASIKEVTVTANHSLAIERQTPIAVSSVNAQFIEEKGAGAEFPELLKSTPGVMVSKEGGGYGDSRINIRGFSSNNVALLINGIPVNDVEAGKIYWNDWAGLSDVTTSMQIQRGLGASTVAVPSLGGTINISTKSTDSQQGGTVLQSVGGYNALKTLVSYSTGLTDKGWASSFLLSKSTGDGTSPGLNYTGYSYFANISKILSKSQSLSFNLMGASQTHGQRYTYNTIATYRTAPGGTQYNSDYGFLNGQLLSAEQNFYNKPLASINHNWTINETTSLSTEVYASYGTGAADYITGVSGANFALAPGAATGAIPRTGNIYSPIDFNAITKNNLANGDGSASTYFQNVNNNHQQYGLLSTLKKKVGDINLLGGLDMRYYSGEHFNTVGNTLGGLYVADIRTPVTNVTSPSGDLNNPDNHATIGQKFNNNYTYDVASEGVFLQAEYVKNNLSAFLTVAGNNTSNRRIDYFNYLNTDPNRESPWVNFLGYQAKAGANYNFDSHNNVFANIGYIQRAPLVASIFLNKVNDINKSAVPEKLFSYELGYGYVSSIFSANVNLYRSTYRDRSKVTSQPSADGTTFSTVNISGLNELHQGIELDGKLRPIKDVTVSGMLSIGDYHYLTNTGASQSTSDNGPTVTQAALLLKGLKIGEFGTASTSAQTTAALGLDVNVLPQVKIGANYNYYARYYASFDPTKLTTTAFPTTGPAYTNYELPNFSTVDMNVVFRFKFAGQDAAFIGNVYNLLNTSYIADAFESTPVAGASYVARTNTMGVYYGTVRTYMTTLKVNFK